MRNPDMIETFSYNGRSYVLTANEGSKRDYEDFEDSIKVKDLFQGQTFGLSGFSVWPRYVGRLISKWITVESVA